jgi:hypothetical protein
LKQTLLDAKASGAVWKFINITDPIDMIGPYGSGDDGGKTWWGGYRAERNELLKFIADNGIKNVVFLASDDHTGRINELTYMPDPSKDPTNPANYKVLDGVISIVDGPMGATGPDTVTDHSFAYVKALADALALKQRTAGLNPVGLDAAYRGLFNVYREGDSTAAAIPKPVDFVSPDTNNYVSLDVAADGVLSVSMRGINSYPQNSFPEPSAAGQSRTLLSFSVDPNPGAFVTAPGAGSNSVIQLRDVSGTLKKQFNAFPGFNGSVSIAYGDLNGDGVKDIVAGAGTGGGPHVKVFDGLSGNEIASFYAYDSKFSGGVSVASGNTDGLGADEIITGAGPGGGPHVKVFNRATDGTVNAVSSFFAYDPNFRGGVEVGTTPSATLGVSAVLTGAGPGGGPHQRGFDISNPLGQPVEILSNFVGPSTFGGGVSVS